jgi:HNH endonuclease
VVDLDELAKVRALKQAYFVRYYFDIVQEHPEGIDSRVVKSRVMQLLIDRFDIDINDATLFGSNKNGSRADQWANNVVSNHVLDDHMLVAHRGRGQSATLWPGTVDNSIPVSGATSVPLQPSDVSSLNSRKPAIVRSSSGSAYQRSPQLAALVRIQNGYKCGVDGLDCVQFEGRNHNPYVEVHHIVPMSLQSTTAINLDRTINMAPLCVGCHKRVHRGVSASASAVVDDMLLWFARTHGMTFADANDDLGLGISAADLMAFYGAMSSES